MMINNVFKNMNQQQPYLQKQQQSDSSKSKSKPTAANETRTSAVIGFMKGVLHSNKRERESSSESQSGHEFETLGGTYHLNDKVDTDDQESFINSSSSSIIKSSQSSQNEWLETNRDGVDHKEGSPLLIRKTTSGRLFRSDEDESIDLEDKELLGRIIVRSQLSGPDSSCVFGYANNVVLVNTERIRRYIVPLLRDIRLDTLAKEHAQLMASRNKLFRWEVDDLSERITNSITDQPSRSSTASSSSSSSSSSSNSYFSNFRRIGINVMSGSNLRSIHDAMMNDSISDQNNALDRRFVHLGVGTSKSEVDGKLYVCQIYLG